MEHEQRIRTASGEWCRSTLHPRLHARPTRGAKAVDEVPSHGG